MAINDIQKPITDTEAANRANAANQVNMQQQLGRMTAQQALQGGPAQAQQAGAMAAEAQGQVAVQATEAAARNQLQSASNAAMQDQLRVQEDNIVKEENLSNKTISQEEELARLGTQYKEELMDSRRNFADYKSEAEFTDHQQNLDLAQELQLSDIDLEDYSREVMQAAQMDIQVMTMAYEGLKAEETRLQQSTANQADRDMLKRIQDHEKALKERIAADKKKANKFSKQVGAAKFVAGAAITATPIPGAAVVGAGMMTSGAKDLSKEG